MNVYLNRAWLTSYSLFTSPDGLACQSYYKNCSYYAIKTTKVKKPCLEKTIFRNLQADLIPLLWLVGLFPKLNDVNVIPQLQLFHLHYTKPSNKQNEMKAIANHTTLGQHNTRLQPHKGVPRDINEAITCILLQSKFDSKPLSLPISLACLFRFCQTSNRLCLDDERGKVFDIGWLVHNNTEPTQLLEQNPPDCRKTPRHMHAFMCSTPRKEQGNAFNISLTSSLNKEKARC